MRTAIVAVLLLAGCSTPPPSTSWRASDANIDAMTDAAPRQRVEDGVVVCTTGSPECECGDPFGFCGSALCGDSEVPAGWWVTPRCDLDGVPICQRGTGSAGCFR